MNKKSTKKVNHQERFEQLQRVAVALMEPGSPGQVLYRIVDNAVHLLRCDGGSIYLKKNDYELEFEVAINQTIDVAFEKRAIPIDGESVAAFCYRKKKALKIEDVYTADGPYKFDPTFDKATGYRTRSVLVQPLISTKGHSLGVLQLVNRKNEVGESWPMGDLGAIAKMPLFSDEDQRLLRSMASLASAAIENALLYSNIEKLFEGFVKAAVQVIEQRDISTRGHSERVAVLTVDLAKAVDRGGDAEVRDIHFSTQQLDELRYAALLHDFGKVTVREETLLKAEKLPVQDKFKIEKRIEGVLYRHEIEILNALLQTLHQEKRAPTDMDLARMQKAVEVYRARMQYLLNAVVELNRPTVLDEDKSKKIQELKEFRFVDETGASKDLLEKHELDFLSIPRGSLSKAERLEIEAHVTQTYKFLRAIPWGDKFSHMAEIAWAHHEKLDGSGYPRRLHAERIPLQSRIMTICDIYDALVAADRPYKKAVPVEKALAIIESETKSGKLDPRFLRVFIEARVFESEAFLALNREKKAA
ncbi:MAG: HD domain-containing protein [Bdellovibrionaceae bacterium]|nr:HD domain-containing protein [Pseudobdellovibrionaceae bacterium]